LAQTRLYQLAATAQWPQCNGSSTTSAEASGCVFNDVTAGSNAVPGEVGYGTASAPYQAAVGFDLATGLGSVNVGNLVNQWAGAGNTPPSSGPVAPPTPQSLTLQSAGAGANITVTFNDPRGWQDLGVVNVLINNFLDGRNACYLAYSRPLGLLYLATDSGSGLTGGLALGATGSVSNSQCSVQSSTASVSANGNTLTLSLNVSFASGFGGSKVIYLAARDVANNNSGWYPMGVYRVAGVVVAANTSVIGMSPATGSGHAQSFTFTFTDSKGWQDLGVVNVLANSALDGRQGCYLAYARATNTLYLFDDSGAPLAGQTLAGNGSASNSQCTVNFAGSSAVGNSNTLTLTLNLTFTSAFNGDRIFYLAARDGNDSNNTGWQAMGAWTVQ